MAQIKEWEKFYDDNLATEWYPSEPVIRLLCSYKKKLGSAGVKVLDLGCGNGRHLWLGAKEGFSVSGIDLSQKAIALAKQWLEKENLPYDDLRSGDASKPLPYEDNFFDIVISYGALDHISIADAASAVREVKRILKPNGTIFLKLEANTSFTFDASKQVAKNELILDKPVERGMIQHFFDHDEILNLTKGFEPVQFFRDDYRRADNLDSNYQSRWIFIGKKK